MAKRSVTVRLDGVLLAWVDAYAELRGSSRTEVLDAALRSFRRDTEAGVPDLAPAKASVDRAGGSASDGARVAPARPAPPRVPGVRSARDLWNEQAMARQQQLNKRKGL